MGDERKNDPVHKRMIMYEPPSDCDKMPTGAPPELFLSTSALCLIPEKDYTPKFMMAEHDKNEQPKADDDDDDMQNQQKTIHAKSPGALLTVSFHVKEVDQILCYLYINGQYLRFMPEDMINILPRFFVESAQNKAFVAKKLKNKKNRAQEFVGEMKSWLKDAQFDAFVNSYCKNNNAQ